MFDVDELLKATAVVFDTNLSSDHDAEMYVLGVTSQLGIPDGIAQQAFAAESLAFGTQWASLVDERFLQVGDVGKDVKQYVQACLRYGFEVYHEVEHTRTLREIAALAAPLGVDVDVFDIDNGTATSPEEGATPDQGGKTQVSQGKDDRRGEDDEVVSDEAVSQGVAQETHPVEGDDSAVTDAEDQRSVRTGELPRFERTVPASNEKARLGISRWEPTGPYEAPEARFRTELQPVVGGRFAPYDTGRRTWDDLDEVEKLDVVEASKKTAGDVRTISDVNKVLSDLALEVITERMARRGWEFKHKIPLKAVVNAFCAVLVAEDGSLEGLEFSEDELNLISVISDYRPQFDAVFENMDLLHSKTDTVQQTQRNLRSLAYEIQRQNDLNTRLMATLLAERMNLGIVERGMNAQNFSISNDQLDEFINTMRAQSFEAGQREQRRQGRLIGQEKMRRDNGGV